MKKTLLIAIALAAAFCLSGCTIATFEAYGHPRHRHVITYPAHEAVVVFPGPHPHPGPPRRPPHRHRW